MASLEEITRSRVGNNDAFFNARVAEFKNRGVPGASNGNLVQPGGELAKLHQQWDAEMAAKNPGSATATPAAEKATIGGAIKDFAAAGVSYGYAWAKAVPGLGSALNGIEAFTYRPYKLISSLASTGISQQSFKALVDWGVSTVGIVAPPVASAYYQAQAMADGFDAGHNVINAVAGKEKVHTSDGVKVLAGVGGGILLGKFGGAFPKLFESGRIAAAKELFVTNGAIAAKVAAAGVGTGVLGTVLSGIKSLVSSNAAPPRAQALPA